MKRRTWKVAGVAGAWALACVVGRAPAQTPDLINSRPDTAAHAATARRQAPVPADASTISDAPSARAVRAASGSALPLEAPAGTDPALWSILTRDEGAFPFHQAMKVRVPSAEFVAVGDIDGDGQPDLAGTGRTAVWVALCLLVSLVIARGAASRITRPLEELVSTARQVSVDAVNAPSVGAAGASSRRRT